MPNLSIDVAKLDVALTMLDERANTMILLTERTGNLPEEIREVITECARILPSLYREEALALMASGQAVL